MLRRVFPLVVLAAVPLSAQQSLTPDQIATAIKAGQDGRYDHMVSACNAGPGFSEGMFATGLSPTGYYSVFVSGPAGEIASRAASAKRRYQAFTVDQVTPEMTEQVLFLSASPDAPERSGNKVSFASPIEAIVLKQKDGPVAIQPLTMALEPVEWKNPLGGSVEGTSATATFSLDDFKEIPAGEVDIVLITAAGERRCKIGRDDRAMLEQLGVPRRR